MRAYHRILQAVFFYLRWSLLQECNFVLIHAKRRGLIYLHERVCRGNPMFLWFGWHTCYFLSRFIFQQLYCDGNWEWFNSLMLRLFELYFLISYLSVCNMYRRVEWRFQDLQQKRPSCHGVSRYSNILHLNRILLVGYHSSKFSSQLLLQLGMKFDIVKSESIILHVSPFNSTKKRGGVAVRGKVKLIVFGISVNFLWR